MNNSVSDYRKRFKMSKRKLPKFFRAFFEAGQEITVGVAHRWDRGIATAHCDTPYVIECLDEYAIVCRHKEHEREILTMDWKGLYSNRYCLEKEIFKKIEEMAQVKSSTQ